MNTIKFALSKTVEVDGKNVRQEIGSQDIYCPSLSEFGIEVEPVGKEDDGSLKYASNEHQFLYGAIVAAVKTATRNKFQPGTDTLRVGAKIAENLAELVAPSVSNKGAALVERRALMASFKQWLVASGKSEAVQRLLLGMLDKPDNILLQDADKRGKIKGYFEAFGEAVGSTMSDWQVAYVSSAIETCDGEELDF